MLRGIRKASSNWLGKSSWPSCVGLIAISFAIWGIGDIFRGFGRSTVAKIGGTEITVEQFRQHLQRTAAAVRPPARPADHARAGARAGPRPAAGRTARIGEASLDERVQALRLGISDAEMASRITTDPAFSGPNGQFDRARFEQMHPQQPGSPSRASSPNSAAWCLRRQLAGTIADRNERCRRPRSKPPTAIRTSSARSNTSCSTARRPARFRAPTPEVLAKYFEERKILFRAPEYRKLVVVSLMPGEQATLDRNLRRRPQARL